jgi:hypothetical protein
LNEVQLSRVWGNAKKLPVRRKNEEQAVDFQTEPDEERMPDNGGAPPDSTANFVEN